MAGEYIEFNNASQPAINDTNLNRLQQLIKQDIQGAVSGDTLPIGAIIPFGSDTVPENWLLCDGSLVSRTTYQDLFNVIGTSYGAGDGFTTFNLPDLRGKVSVGKSSDTEFDTLGETGGEKTHNHVLGTSAYAKIIDDGQGKLYMKSTGGRTWEHNSYMPLGGNATYGTGNQSYGVDLAGTTNNSSSLQPYIVTNYIIKAAQTSGLVATVVDNLNSDSATDALSAKQGKMLNESMLKAQVVSGEIEFTAGGTKTFIPNYASIEGTVVSTMLIGCVSTVGNSDIVRCIPNIGGIGNTYNKVTSVTIQTGAASHIFINILVLYI